MQDAPNLNDLIDILRFLAIMIWAIIGLIIGLSLYYSRPFREKVYTKSKLIFRNLFDL